MDAVSYRRELGGFLGPERFRRLVTDLIRRGKLRYWSQVALSQFVAVHPDLAVSDEDLPRLLRFCVLHGLDLLPDRAEVTRDIPNYTTGYIQARDRMFPNAAIDPVAVGPRIDEDSIGVWFCPACREAQTAWGGRSTAEVPQDFLVGPTTFRDYMGRFLDGLDPLSPKLLSLYELRAAEVAAKLRPGDELWEWCVKGGPFSSCGGLAVLRNGAVVEWWREWVS